MRGSAFVFIDSYEILMMHATFVPLYIGLIPLSITSLKSIS